MNPVDESYSANIQLAQMRLMQEAGLYNNGNFRKQNPATPEKTTERHRDVAKLRLFHMMEESVKDSIIKMQRATIIKVTHHTTLEFEIGYAMCEILDKYKSMIIIYRQTKALTNPKSNSLKIILSLQRLEQLSVEIINIANMIFLVRKPKTNSDDSKSVKMPKHYPGKGKAQNNPDNDDSEERQDREDEENLKRSYRKQKQLEKRLGK